MEAIDFRDLAKIAYGPGYYRRVAEAVCAQVQGASYHEAVSTESVYISIPGAMEQLRISGHQKYGCTAPYHCNPKTKKGLPSLVDRAVRAAMTGATRYQDVKPWDAL